MFKFLGVGLGVIHLLIALGLFGAERTGSLERKAANKIVYALFCLTGVWMFWATKEM